MFDAGNVEGEMTEDDRAYLEDYYAADVVRLEEDFGVETAVWQRSWTTPEQLPSSRA